MRKKSLKLAAIMFAAFLMLSGCSMQNSGETDSSGASKTESSAPAESSAQPQQESQDGGLEYQMLVTSTNAAKEELLKGAWMYLDGTVLGEDPEKVLPDADKDAWYYGSSLWFEADGSGKLTIGGYDSTMSYKINDDCTISMTHGNPETTEHLALGQHEKYGTILYSKTDKNIIFYQAIF